MMDITFGNVTNVRLAWSHTHPLGDDNPAYHLDCNACRVGRRLHNAEQTLEPYHPIEWVDDWPDFAPYVRLAWCKAHGLEAVTGHRTYNTGYDRGVAGEFACGAIVEEDVF